MQDLHMTSLKVPSPQFVLHMTAKTYVLWHCLFQIMGEQRHGACKKEASAALLEWVTQRLCDLAAE